MADVPAELVAWIEDQCGGRVDHCQRVSGGNRRRSWAVDVLAGGTVLPLFLRFDPGDPDATGDPYTIRREAAVYEVVAQTAVRAPRLVGLHPVLPAVLTERVSGSPDLHQVADAEEQIAIAADLMRQLAVLHRHPVADLDLGALGPARSIGEHIDAELDAWEALYRETDGLDPLVEHALRWLRAHRPAPDEPPALVHGDFGPGNFLFEDGRVTTLVDWEFCHLGDPMEDLAWLSMRMVFQAFPDVAARLADYEEAAGRPIDGDRVRYHRVLVQTRVAIIRHRDMGNPDPGGDVGNGLVSRAVNRRLLVEELAALEGVDLDGLLATVGVDGADGADAEQTWLFDAALGQIRRTATETTDRAVAVSLKSLARTVKYLRECERRAPDLDRREREVLHVVLRGTADDLGRARQQLAVRLRSGELTGSAPYPYFAFDIAKDRLLMGPSLGALADRHLPPLAVATTPEIGREARA